MNDISYEILDLFKKYGADKEGILKILEADSRPEVLYALSDIRRNLMDWMDFSGQEHVLQFGSDYGVITGLLAERCASVAVVDERDENLVVNQKMNEAHTNISYIKAADFQKMEAVEKEGKYDLVVLRADRPDMDIKECFTRLSSYLSENGKLIFACENALGLNFLSGAVHDEDETAFTKGELEEALKEAGLSKVEFYYPMPEYKRAVSVYSDRYLPGKGDIPHVTAVYDRQRWACIHEDEISDKLVQEKAFGLFSNAYLAVASKGAESFKTVFAKYNSTRKEEFQIRTAILEENGKRYVEKTPLTEKAAGHISSMSEKYEKLSKVNPGVKVLVPVYSKDKKAVRFEFLKGRTLAEILGDPGKESTGRSFKSSDRSGIWTGSS
jgi:protein-L-isoaspartate O-methyltransferase